MSGAKPSESSTTFHERLSGRLRAMARIAFLYSGLPRQWARCISSQLALFREHDVDVFCHFWDTIDASEKTDIVDAYRPKAYRFDPPMDFTSWEAVAVKR